MKVITLMQPWATLFLSPEKLWETRSWQTKHRGCLIVHSSAKLPSWARELCFAEPFASALARCGIEHPDQLRLGQILGAVNITGMLFTEHVANAAVDLPRGACELTFGDYTPGRFAWGRSAEVFRLEETIACVGNRMLWKLPPSVERIIRSEMVAAGWRHREALPEGNLLISRRHTEPAPQPENEPALFNLDTTMRLAVPTLPKKPGETEFEVLKPAGGLPFAVGQRFYGKKTSSRFGRDLARWLEDGFIREASTELAQTEDAQDELSQLDPVPRSRAAGLAPVARLAPSEIVVEMSREEMEPIGAKVECMKLSERTGKKAPGIQAFEHGGQLYVAVHSMSSGAKGYHEIAACPLLRPAQILAGSVPKVRDWSAGRMCHYGQEVTYGGKPYRLGAQTLKIVQAACANPAPSAEEVAQPKAEEPASENAVAEVWKRAGEQVKEIVHNQTPARVASLVDINRIRPDPTQPRVVFAAEAMAELVESVRVHGITNPITVRVVTGKPDVLEIVAGERRWRAAKEAGHATVPAFIRHLSDVEAAELQAVENLQRVDLSPLEEARGYKKLLDLHNGNVDKVVQVTGKARNTIYGKLKLLDMPELVKQAVESGALPASTAEFIARQEGEVQQKAIEAVLHPKEQQAEAGKPLSLAATKETVLQLKYQAQIADARLKATIEMEEKGFIVLEGEEEEGVLSFSDTVAPNGEYVGANDLCRADPLGRTWAELMKDSPTVRRLAVIANSRRDGIKGVEIFAREEAEAVLKERGLLAPPQSKPAAKPSAPKAQKSKPEPEPEEENAPPKTYIAERQAQAIQAARKHVYDAQESAQKAKDALRDLEGCIHTIRRTDEAEELQKLLDRVQEHQRKFNAMELGSFMLRVNRAMEEAWGRLP